MRYVMKTVAEGYLKLPDETHLLSKEDIKLLKDFTKHLYLNFSKENAFIFQKSEPYNYLENGFEQMREDSKKGFIRVSTSGDDSELLGDYNLMFRAAHDYIHVLTDKTFGYEDEIATFESTTQLFRDYCRHKKIRYNTNVEKIFRSEIIYQSAFKNINRDNIIEQKIILTDL